MKRILGACIFLASLTQVHAEPTPVVRYLMGEPVSAFDFGLYRLGEHLSWEQARLKGFELPVQVRTVAFYMWDENRIHLLVSVFPQVRELTPAAAKSACREAGSVVRYASGIDPDTGEPYKSNPIFNVSRLFQSESHSKARAPENIPSELLAIMELRIEVFVSPAGDGVQRSVAECAARLLGKDVLFKG